MLPLVSVFYFYFLIHKNLYGDRLLGGGRAGRGQNPSVGISSPVTQPCAGPNGWGDQASLMSPASAAGPERERKPWLGAVGGQDGAGDSR